MFFTLHWTVGSQALPVRQPDADPHRGRGPHGAVQPQRLPHRALRHEEAAGGDQGQGQAALHLPDGPLAAAAGLQTHLLAGL